MQKNIFEEITNATQSTEISLKDIDLTGKTQNQLAELARSALGESLSLARRSVESAWCAGKFLDRARTNAKHGTWRTWLEENDIDKSMASRVMQVYREYDLSQIETFDTVTAALKAIPRKQIERPKPEPETDLPSIDHSNDDEAVGPAIEQARQDNAPMVAVDIRTGKETEWNATDRQPSAEEQLRAHEGAPMQTSTWLPLTEQPRADEGAPTETQDLTARDLKKNGGVPTEPRKPQSKTMRRNMRYSEAQNGIEVLESLGITDYVVISVRDLWRLANGYPVQNAGADQVIYQKGEVIR